MASALSQLIFSVEALSFLVGSAVRTNSAGPHSGPYNWFAVC